MEIWEKRKQLIERLEELSKLETLDEAQQTEWDDTTTSIDRLDAQVARQKRLDELALQTPTLEKKAAEADEKRAAENHTDRPETATVKIPAVARWCPGRLKAFRTEDGRNDVEAAYRAGQFYAATLFRNEYAQRWCRDNGIEIRQANWGGSGEVRAMSEGVNTAGGFLVPEVVEAMVIRLVEERGVFRRFADVRTMPSDVHNIPKRDGGLTLYYPGEGGTITASDVSYTNVKLTARKAATLTKVSTELSEDSLVSVSDQITTEIAYAMADGEDLAGFIGDGTSTYGHISGIITRLAAGATYTAATGNTAFSTLDLADFEGAVGNLKIVPGMDIAWYISSVGYWQSMARLANAGGGNTTETLASGPNVRMFMGYPVRFVQVMNSTTGAQTSTNGLCFVGDLARTAVMGVRRGVTVAVSNDVYFTDDSIGIRGTERFDINVHEIGTATADDAGTMVQISTPAS